MTDLTKIKARYELEVARIAARSMQGLPATRAYVTMLEQEVEQLEKKLSALGWLPDILNGSVTTTVV